MLIDTDEGAVEWRRVVYPYERTQQRMLEVGLPLRLVNRLAHGL